MKTTLYLFIFFICILLQPYYLSAQSFSHKIGFGSGGYYFIDWQVFGLNPVPLSRYCLSYSYYPQNKKYGLQSLLSYYQKIYLPLKREKVKIGDMLNRSFIELSLSYNYKMLDKGIVSLLPYIGLIARFSEDSKAIAVYQNGLFKEYISESPQIFTMGAHCGLNCQMRPIKHVFVESQIGINTYLKGTHFAGTWVVMAGYEFGNKKKK